MSDFAYGQNPLYTRRMGIRPRYLAAQVRQDLRRKMVFVAGPRQVGKTTLARALLGASAGYLSWEVAEHRERILRRELPPSRLWIFDEVHKYRSWRAFTPEGIRVAPELELLRTPV